MPERLSVIGPEGEEIDLGDDLARAFVKAMETIGADVKLRRGELPGVEELALRSARGASDMLSRTTAKIAARLWRQTGRRGFRASIVRFRAAAMMALRWWTAWLEYVFGWPVRHVAEISAECFAPAERSCGPPLRRSAPDAIVRCYPRTGPPLGGPVPGVLYAMGRSGP